MPKLDVTTTSLGWAKTHVSVDFEQQQQGASTEVHQGYAVIEPPPPPVEQDTGLEKAREVAGQLALILFEGACMLTLMLMRVMILHVLPPIAMWVLHKEIEVREGRALVYPEDRVGPPPHLRG